MTMAISSGHSTTLGHSAQATCCREPAAASTSSWGPALESSPSTTIACWSCSQLSRPCAGRYTTVRICPAPPHCGNKALQHHHKVWHVAQPQWLLSSRLTGCVIASL